MTGSDLQRTIHDLLFYDGWLVLRVNQGGLQDKRNRHVRFAYWSKNGHDYERPEGVADLLAFKDGVLLAVEIKGDRDVVRDSQVDFMEAVGTAGAIPIIARSVDDIREWLSRVTIA